MRNFYTVLSHQQYQQSSYKYDGYYWLWRVGNKMACIRATGATALPLRYHRLEYGMSQAAGLSAKSLGVQGAALKIAPENLRVRRGLLI